MGTRGNSNKGGSKKDNQPGTTVATSGEQPQAGTYSQDPAKDAEAVMAALDPGKMRKAEPNPILKVKYSSEAHDITRATAGSAGLDLSPSGCCGSLLMPGSVRKVQTGVFVEIPEGYVGIIALRSSVASRGDLYMAGGIGVVDSDYRGEIHIPVATSNVHGARITPGERIAQLLILPAPIFDIEVVQELGETARGDGGFGSTGK